jgi:hypothetical protein
VQLLIEQFAQMLLFIVGLPDELSMLIILAKFMPLKQV